MAQKSHLAEVTLPLSGDRVIDPADVQRSLIARNAGIVAIGSGDRSQREMQTDEHGIAYVDMNHSGRLKLAEGKTGVIATSSLAGCTGVAGFAKRADGGTAQFVSHHDAISQTWHFTRQDTPVNTELYGFRYYAKDGSEIVGPLQYLVAFPATERSNPRYGQRQGSFEQWFYLDQIETTAAQLGPDAQVLFLPYSNGDGNCLAAGRTDDGEGIFWNGVRVDFAQYFPQGETS